MVMFLMVLAMGMLGLAVSAALLKAAAPSADTADLQQPARVAEPQRFFVQPAPVIPPTTPQSDVPVEVLLAQLERHIRLEQAAAESFVQAPTAASLHGRTASPLMH